MNHWLAMSVNIVKNTYILPGSGPRTVFFSRYLSYLHLFHLAEVPYFKTFFLDVSNVLLMTPVRLNLLLFV